jgi:GTP cyclohydrolase-4
MRTHSENILREEGFSASESALILKVLPAPSHNQRGRGTLIIGSDERVAAENLVHIVEASMSSETYELLKRPDEFMVVNKAHHNPRFVEDVVREMLLNVAEVLTFLPDDAFVLAKQVNFEGIHKHDAYAERNGLLGDIRAELNQTGGVSKHISLHDWLRG